jgi:hypothetical protein
MRIDAAYDLGPVLIGVPKMGHELVTIGHPYDLYSRKTELTVTRGTMATWYSGRELFRMTAQTLPGASGSAVYDMETGALVGVVSMYMRVGGHRRLAYDGHYYAVPAALVFDILEIPGRHVNAPDAGPSE